MSMRDIQIALITAMTESNLINVNYGDRDSLGLFQQRPSQGWGTPEQVMNPHYAAGKFFSALKDLGRRRYSMGMGQAAQAVQRSAFPDRYATKIPGMRANWNSVVKWGGGGNATVMSGPNTPEALGIGTGTAGGNMFNPDAILDPDQLRDGPIPPAQLLGTWGGVAGLQPDDGIPDVSSMLGAWDMDNPPVGEGIESLLMDGSRTMIGGATNSSVIRQLMDESFSGGSFDFGKGVNGKRAAIIQYAKSALGTPYRWGGNSLQGGVDCSGLVMAAFAKAGINMPRISYQQANRGQRTSIKNLRPGDLVAWNNSSRNPGADHIAIYIGGGRIIEAARPGTSVRIRKLGKNEGAWGVHLDI